MLIIPHGAELSIGRRSYVTYAIVILCVLIHLLQESNRDKISTATEQYCSSIYQPFSNDDTPDIFRDSQIQCEHLLAILHYDVHGDLKELLSDNIDSNYSYLDDEKRSKIMISILQHYEIFSADAPASLDAKLMYYPGTFNPFTSIVSSLSHGDWWHVMGNLIFFMAFAPAIEVLIGNWLKYLGFIIAISFITSISYSLATLMGTSSLPTLGLSGVVMGMIGMAGFLMPKVKIRVFIWFFTIIKNIYVQAWILAVWYIGWDTWDMLTGSGGSGINVVAHVSGGFAGYGLAYLFLQDRRADIQEGLYDEICHTENMRKEGCNLSTYVEPQLRQKNKQVEKDAVHAQEDFLAVLHQHVRVKDSPFATVAMIEKYDLIPSNAEMYEHVFQAMRKWGKSKALTCIGRAAIHLLLINKFTARALIITEQCQEMDESFCLVSPQEVLELAMTAQDQHKYMCAYRLIKKAGMRYGFQIDVVRCKLLEVELLWSYLNQQDEARHQMQILQGMKRAVNADAIDALAKKLNMDD